MTENHHVDGFSCARRRTVLKGAVFAGIATPLLAACGSGDSKDSAASGSTTENSGGGAGSGGSSAGSVLASTSDIKVGSGTIFTDEGIVVTQPKPGEFKGFTNICTHMGCPVHDVTTTINCTCHGSQYSIVDGSVVTGPATQALDGKPVTVKGNDITLG
jgi:Rieske Fe-S protein